MKSIDVREDKWKLIRQGEGTPEIYDLDPVFPGSSVKSEDLGGANQGQGKK